MSNGLPDVRRFATPDEMSRAAATAFCAGADAAVRSRGGCVVAMAGGTTPMRLYDCLALPPFRDRVDWQSVDVFFGDERAVPPHDPGSNYRMVNEHLLSQVGIPAAQVHRIKAEAADLDEAAAEYSATVARRVTPEVAPGSPSFDLVLLGLGADGHTASLFPGSPALDETQRWFVPSTSPQPPFGRVTATVPLINAARSVVFLVAGADKAEALAAVLEGPEGTRRLPAQLVGPRARVIWFVDDAAASRLARINGRVPT